MAREGQGYPCYQHDMMMMMNQFKCMSILTHVNPSRVILSLEVIELRTLYVHIYIFGLLGLIAYQFL